ncbi:hypothetical protein HYY74_03105 [Candidatus Woesearchaeota archaeon]|nr:hypothetical protein [Candidatus Woesearchaeota archaeon]
MYDPAETDISLNELNLICQACRKERVNFCIIGGWAAFFYVNEAYRQAFGKDYIASRDIDLFFDPLSEKGFAKVIFGLGFEKNGLPFRYEKIYHREKRKFISIIESRKEPPYNLIRVFLDLFSNKPTTAIHSWNDLDPLKSVSVKNVNGYPLADMDTLMELKAICLFERDKADKENKDACDFYSLLQYGRRKIAATQLKKKAVEKLLSRPDLIDSIARNVLLDVGKSSIVDLSLRNNLLEFDASG